MDAKLEINGLNSIVNKFDLYFIDIWGVLHNGVRLYDEAVNCLTQLDELEKEYVLLTNAPRPNNTVKEFLKKIGLDEKKRNKVFTSGQAALDTLKKKYNNLNFFHVGPPKDFDLFKEFKENKTNNISKADFILCTGLFENEEDDLDFYKNLFKKYFNVKMICTNPDLTVYRGSKKEYCAGSVAKVFEEIGGKVEYFGKPYSLIYETSTDIRNKRILCVGDNLNTDIKGANNLNFESLFIYQGVHKEEIERNFDQLFKKYQVRTNYIQKNLKW